MDVTAGETALIPPAPPKIDLNAIGSAMTPPIRREAAVASTPPALAVDKVWCGTCSARVPEWFGDGCIAAACPLRVAA
jgi:hypothetical protein